MKETSISEPARSSRCPGGQREKVHCTSILVPTDFSSSSYKALDYAVVLADLFSAELTLAHVLVPITVPDSGYGPVTWDESAAIRSAQERLDAIRRDREHGRRRRLHAVVRMGHPYAQIDQIAAEIKADLIVLSTHGRSGLMHFFLGSVAEKVIRHAPCPVLIVREKEHEFITG